MVDFYRLAVLTVVISGRSITHMPDSHLRARKPVQYFRCENFTYKTRILMGNENPVIIDYDSGAFLASVLQRIETVIGKACSICRLVSASRRKGSPYFARKPPCDLTLSLLTPTTL